MLVSHDMRRCSVEKMNKIDSVKVTMESRDWQKRKKKVMVSIDLDQP